MRTLKTLALTLGLVVAVLLPATVQANDKEWARVGKVAAVLVGLDLLGHAVACPPPPPWHRRHVEYRSYYYASPPPPVIVYSRPVTSVEYVVEPAPAVERVVVVSPPPAVARVVVADPPPPQPTDYSTPRSNQALASRGPVTKPAAKDAAATETVAKTATTADAIIVELDEGRRLYQPKVKGEKAQLQVWSEIEQRWVPVKDYPSLY